MGQEWSRLQGRLSPFHRDPEKKLWDARCRGLFAVAHRRGADGHSRSDPIFHGGPLKKIRSRAYRYAVDRQQIRPASLVQTNRQVKQSVSKANPKAEFPDSRPNRILARRGRDRMILMRPEPP